MSRPIFQREGAKTQWVELRKAVGLAAETQRRRGKPLRRFLFFTAKVTHEMEWKFIYMPIPLTPVNSHKVLS